MNASIYDRYRSIVYAETGISLGPSKQALVASRVGKRMRALGLSDYDEYLRQVDEDETGTERGQLVDAICTNVTSFFRESDHFAFVRETVVRDHAAGRERFRIWSAACSTGEEAYSLAMSVHDLSEDGCDIRILGTDLSVKALRVAIAGTYPASKVENVNARLRDRFFYERDVAGTTSYEVTSELRSLVALRQLNLSRPPFPMHGPLDIVLCRNVMIYFDKPVRERLLAEIHRLLKPGGHLIVGHAETLSGADGFHALQPSIYERQ